MRFIDFYYRVKPFIPRHIQLFMRRRLISFQIGKCAALWPIDENASKRPECFEAWPQGQQFALVLTHDVDTLKGYERVWDLAMMEKDLGFRSAFGFVPAQRYTVDMKLLEKLTQAGFEVYLHDFNHDGKLFSNYDLFKQRLPFINKQIKEWGARGFRAGAMHHNLEWIGEMDIEYDMSTFDTDPFEPQPDALQSIYPLKIRNKKNSNSYIELPYTLPQDFSLFVLMEKKDIDVWKCKLDWIARKGAMVLLNTHPDYMCLGNGKCGAEEYPIEMYEKMLRYITDAYAGRYWNALPCDMGRFWNGLHSDKTDG